jgi:histone acetyltransferase MYST1
VIFNILKLDERSHIIHYANSRLDEWVTFDKFLLDSLNRLDKNEPDKEPAVSTSSAAPVHGAVVSDLGVGKTIGSAGSKSIGSSAGGASKAIVNSAGGASKSGRRYRSSLGGKLPQPPPSAENLDQSPPNADASSFSLTGGNWHGIGGDPALAALEREHEETTRLKNIQKIVMGGWEIEAWYYSPYPGKYGQAETLYVCEYCLKYMRKQTTFRRHVSSCLVREPPGTEIYRDGRLSVYEIDGKEQRCYCQLLCLLAKLYIDHKTLYYDVDPFYFYVVTEVDEFGSHIVGYFSKEKVRTRLGAVLHDFAIAAR